MQELREEYLQKSHEGDHSFKDPETGEWVELRKWREVEDLRARLREPLPGIEAAATNTPLGSGSDGSSNCRTYFTILFDRGAYCQSRIPRLS